MTAPRACHHRSHDDDPPHDDPPHDDPPHDDPRRNGPRHDGPSWDDGFSFIEVLLAIILIGIVVVPVLQAVTVSIHASHVSRSAGQVETALVNAADRLNRAPVVCDYSVYAEAAVQTQGWAPEQVALVQQYYVPAADVTINGTWQSGSANSPACQISTPTDGLVQRIRLTITSPDGSISRTVEVVKSDV